MTSNKIEIESGDGELKHLGFIRSIAINSVICALNVYEYAKDKSGPLKSTVENVEKAVGNVVGPLCDKFKSVPAHVLVLLDNKVDEATTKFGEHAPPLAKQAAIQAQSLAQKASKVTEDLAHEASSGGPLAAINYAGTLSKQSVLCLLAKVWYQVNQVPPLHSVAQMTIPTATNLSEKYNKAISNMANEGYVGFSYVPLVPIEEMAKAYEKVEAAKKGVDTSVESETQTDMD